MAKIVPANRKNFFDGTDNGKNVPSNFIFSFDGTKIVFEAPLPHLIAQL